MGENNWNKRHFAAYVPNGVNKFVCFNDRDTQKQATGVKSWKYAKLMDEE